MITSARCSRSTQWPETRIGSTCGALSVILLPFGFLCCCRVLSMWILQLSHCLLIWGRCQGWLTLSSSCTRCYSVSCCLTLVHAHLHSFIRTCSFSLVRVCFTGTRSCVCSHLFAFIFSCTGSFFRVCIRFHVYAFVFTRTCSFSLVQVHLQLYMYACLILSWTLIFSHSFSVGCPHSQFMHSFSVVHTRFQLDALVLGWTHSFLVVHTRSWLDTLILGCTHLFSPVCTRPRPHTHT